MLFQKEEGSLDKIDTQKERTPADDFLDFVLITDTVLGDDDNDNEDDEDEEE